MFFGRDSAARYQGWTITFDTFAEASAAGYLRPREINVRVPGGQIRAHDVSPGSSSGYDFQIVASPVWVEGKADPGWIYLRPSSTVNFRQERNAGGSLGCYAPMFTPEAILASVPEARRYLAEWYRASGMEADDVMAAAAHAQAAALAPPTAQRERRVLQMHEAIARVWQAREYLGEYEATKQADRAWKALG